MPRQMRYYLSDVTQHVIQRGNNRQPTFLQDTDYHVYLECLRQAMFTHACDVHAYVLMPNHVHLLVTPHRVDGVPRLMQAVGRSYVHYFNQTYERTGTLWEGRYKASLVDSVSYLLSCYQYIELNPVRAKLVQDPADYRWSSYRHHALGEPNDVLIDHPLDLRLGATPRARNTSYRRLFGTRIETQVLEEIRECLHHCGVLGNDRFKDRVERMLHRRVRPGKRGRPKKAQHVTL